MATTPSGGTPKQNFQQRARADSKKLDMVLKTLEDIKWSPSQFVLELLRLKKIGQEGVAVTVTWTDKHKWVVKTMLNGTTKPFIGEILDLLWRNANRTEFQENDKSVPPGHKMFIGNSSWTCVAFGPFCHWGRWASTISQMMVLPSRLVHEKGGLAAESTAGMSGETRGSHK